MSRRASKSEAARREVEPSEIMRLARTDQIRFAEALVKPVEPNEQLSRAARRHADLIERS
jgi:uncharacterized protein (DUF1778 family)